MDNGTRCKHGVHYGDTCGKCAPIYTEEELQAAITEAVEEDRNRRAPVEPPAAIQIAANRMLEAKLRPPADPSQGEAYRRLCEYLSNGPSPEVNAENLSHLTAITQPPAASQEPPAAGEVDLEAIEAALTVADRKTDIFDAAWAALRRLRSKAAPT